MPTLRQAQALFDAKSEAGEVPNRVTGEMGKLARSRRGPIMTHVTAALRHAIRGHPEFGGHLETPTPPRRAEEATQLPARGRQFCLGYRRIRRGAITLQFRPDEVRL